VLNVEPRVETAGFDGRRDADEVDGRFVNDGVDAGRPVVEIGMGAITFGSCRQLEIGSLHWPVPVQVMNLGPFSLKPCGQVISAREPKIVPLGVVTRAFCTTSGRASHSTPGSF
jgi:hypothetical protein